MTYSELTKIENLFQAWAVFRKGKKKRLDLQIFERHLEDNLFTLQQALQTKTYRHGTYQDFYIHDPKTRHIHKAFVQDRVIHHLLYKYLYCLFDKNFILDSYSCREDKGTHKAVKRLEKFTRQVSKNYTSGCWLLKCDIKKFFASVDHEILLYLFKREIKDEDILWLIFQVINSFCTCHPELISGSMMLNQVQHDNNPKGIPLGNLTSQIFANIYMNELDQFVKNCLRVKYYLRYADDFLIVSTSKEELSTNIVPVSMFLKDNLKMELHPKKIIFRRLDWGVDFLGYIVLPYYIVPRTKTKRRMFQKIQEGAENYRNGNISQNSFNQTVQSYLGFLKHANSYRLTQKLKNQIWFWTA